MSNAVEKSGEIVSLEAHKWVSRFLVLCVNQQLQGQCTNSKQIEKDIRGMCNMSGNSTYVVWCGSDPYRWTGQDG